MKILNLTIECKAYYKTTIEVDDSMDIEDACRLAESHFDDLQYEELEYVPGYDIIDKNNSFFS